MDRTALTALRMERQFLTRKVNKDEWKRGASDE